uniref:cysteine dioxygenase n=1 Tax=Oryza sativa subsp. japonica TaxID=39947 RepID=Q84YM8_ORYSJ|nr:HGWP repeat containing protein-like [Oryza sativa Japonica Group]
MGVYDFTAGLPPSPPSGASAYTAGLLCHRCWASTTSSPACLRRRRLVSSPIRLVGHTTVHGRLRLHRRPASVAADWCPRLYGWLVTPPFMGVYDFTAGLPPSPPTGVSAYTAGLLCHRCWASTTSPPACLRRRRLVSSPIRLVGHTTVHGRLRLHRRPASVAADWCLRLHSWPIMPPLLGVYDFTAGLPPSPPSGASAYTAGLLCRRCWMSTSSPLAHLRCRRLVFPLTRLTYYAAISGHLRFHRRPPSSPPTGVFIVIDGRLCSHIGHFCHHQGEYYKAKIQIQICIKWIHGFKLISYAPGMDQSEHHHRLAVVAADWRLHFHHWFAFATADWCHRLHGWPIMPPLLGVYVFTDRLAFAAADWCFRLHGWPIMPPLLGVYVFTDRLAFAAADWCFRLHGWPLCRRCWASTSSPTGLPSPPPTGVSACTVGLYAAVVGRLRLHRLACLRRCRLVFPPARLAFMPPLLGVYVFTDRPPRPPPTGASACTAGLLCRRCWASTSSPTGRLVRRRLVLPPARLAYYAAVVGRLRLHRPACLRRRRLVFPPARLAFMPPLLGVYVFTDWLAFAAADWCFRLHGWPLCRHCWASTSSPTGLPSPPPTGVSACTAGLYAAVVGRLRLHRPAASSAADWCFRLHGWPIMPPLLGVYVVTDRPPRPPPTATTTDGHHHLPSPTDYAAADWCFYLHNYASSLPTFYFNNFKYFGLDELGNNINSPPIICLHGWPTTQLPIEDLIVIIGCYIAIDWITDIVIFINILSSLINIANSAAVDGKLRHHSRLSLLPLIIITVGCVCRRRLFSSSS